MGAPTASRFGIVLALSAVCFFGLVQPTLAQSQCGNTTCDHDENEENCPADCGPQPVCGNLICQPQIGENLETCPTDCKCGNETCDAGETAGSCPVDCGCGNTICDPEAGESPETCPADCQPVCVPITCGSQCGQIADGCFGTLDCGSCGPGPSCDFSEIPPHLQFCCGNGDCDGGENPNNCAQDCAGECGDDICSPHRGETPNNCSDCCYTEYCTAGCAALPSFDISVQETVIYEPVTLTAFANSLSGSTVNWDFGDGNHCEGCGLTVQHMYLTPGLKTIRMTATENVCSSTQISFPLYLQVRDRAVRRGDHALITGHTLPSTLTCGQTTTAAITVRNLGDTTWTAASGYALGAVGDADPFAATTRYPLAPGISIAPLEYYTFQVPLTASESAMAMSDWQMVREGVAWFGETASSTITPTGNCTDPPGPPSEQPYTFSCRATVKDGYGRPFAGAQVKFMLSGPPQPGEQGPEFGEIAFREGVTNAMGEVTLSAISDADVKRMDCAVYDSRYGNQTKRETPRKRGLLYVERDVAGVPKTTHMTLTAAGDTAFAPQPDDERSLAGRRPGLGAARVFLPAGRDYSEVSGVLVIPEPMDFLEQKPELRRDWQELWATFRDLAVGLYGQGVAVWMVEPYRTGQNLHEQAAEFAQGVEVAATSHEGGAPGGKVVVGGYSLGGIVARMATARWEGDAAWRAELGLSSTLPVSMVVFGDAPLRGAVANLDLQKFLWDENKAGLSNLNSCAVQQLLQESYAGKNLPAASSNWSNFYLGGAGVSFIQASSPSFDNAGVCDAATNNVCSCEAGPPVFAANGDGYPHSAQIAALAVSAWGEPNRCYGDDRDKEVGGKRLCGDALTPAPGWTFARLEAPWCLFRPTSHDFRVRAEDLVPGSKLSTRFDSTDQFGEHSKAWLGALFFGIGPLLCPASLGGNATLQQFFAPTFIPIASALDGNSAETSRFGANAAWLGKDGSPAYNAAHNVLPPPLQEWLMGKLAEGFGLALAGAPKAALSAPQTLATGAVGTFSAAGSVGSGGQVVDAFWDFGDGNAAEGVSATHTFTAPGRYGVTLTIVTTDGQETSASAMVDVGQLPGANTPAGSNVVVDPYDEAGEHPLMFRFARVLTNGMTMSSPVSTQGLPQGTQWARRIDTTADYVGLDGAAVEICLSRVGVAGDPSRFRILQSIDLSWVDITTSYDSSGERVCGLSPSLSSVALLRQPDVCDAANSCSWPILAAPLLTPAPGSYSGVVAFSASAVGGAEVRYTTDGSVPSVDSSLLLGTLGLTSSAVVRARAFKDGWTPSAVAQASYTIDLAGPQLVEWTNLANTGGVSGTIAKVSGGAAAWDAGAASTMALASGDGYVEFRAGNPSHYVIAGLSNGDAGTSWSEVDFAFYLYPTGLVSIYESGNIRATEVTTFVAGDIFRISVEGGTIKYRKNGALLFASGGAATFPLLFDVAMYSLGASIFEARISGTVAFVGAARPVLSPAAGNFLAAPNATISCVTPGTTIHFTLDGSEPAEGSPTLPAGQTISIPGPFTVVKAKAFGAGLFASPTVSGHYSVGLETTEAVEWTNLANVAATTGTITKNGGGAASWDAGASSTRAITSSEGYFEFRANPGEYAFAGLSLGDTGTSWAEIDYAFYLFPSGSLAIYENGVWREGVSGSFVAGDALRIAVEGGVVRYRKNGVLVHSSTVPPSYPLRADTALYRVGGTIQSATLGGTLTWVGAARPTFSPGPGNYTSGQNVALATTTPGVTIWYTTDGSEPTELSPVVANGGHVLVAAPFTNLKARAWSPGLATSPATSGHYSVGPLTTEPVEWTRVVNASASGSTVSKPAGGAIAWDAGASSAQAIVSSDGYVEFKANPNEYVFGGLSAGDPSVSWAEVDYAFYVFPTGVAAIYENGVWREGVSTSYAAGDTLRVALENGVVKYRKNGQLIYTSAVAPSFPLLLDASMYRPNSSLQQAVISGNLVR